MMLVKDLDLLRIEKIVIGPREDGAPMGGTGGFLQSLNLLRR
jgi:hypothetical protein